MSLDFDGVDDKLQSATQTLGDLLSVAFWFNPDVSDYYFVEHGGSGRLRLRTAPDQKFQIQAQSRTVSGGSWVTTAAVSNMLTGWKWAMVTLNIGNGSTDKPRLYLWDGSVYSRLTVGAGLTENSAMAGNPPADTQTLSFGAGALSTVFHNGQMGEIAWWKRLLSDADAAAVFHQGVNAMPDHFHYLPCDGGRSQNLGSSGAVFTVTGAIVGENPPIRPAGRRG